ncbi:L,D-transpeptidase family protein [Myroides sp. 1354]|uniref:L,D-transpeptidase family protein n=1 Tax=unclassified Myroides TaxID=2642485 RepID=UPI0025769C7E|nr:MULTISPECIES: L,D-transpeptidase family protein [unclassified Myroides]MDM1043261.1 L,D-transpeptidase family protein [Myroides sp. R163-1]MDM1054686.1 L,D-transpeptidase family protein [Myroides sp. 1354]MDM1067983.1 L,D-transpeptidase family protein [Myroides sp. 1372]
MIKKIILPTALLTCMLSSCGERSKQAMRVIYGENEVVEALNEVPNIQFDSLQTSTLQEDVRLFYKNNDYHLGWFNADNRQQLLSSVDDLKYDGIKIAAKEIHKLADLNATYEQLDETAKIQADFLFSTMYVNTLDNLFNGSVRAKRLYGDWEITPKPLNTSATMLLALEHKNITLTYDSIRTKQPVYTQLRNKLTSYYNLEQDSLKPFKQGKINDTIPELVAIKKHLIFLNQLPDSMGTDAIYNKATAQSIKAFQTQKKLNVTGYTDTKTIDAILRDENTLKEKIIVNLERWRWFPRDFSSNYILVNIPAYSLVSVSNRDTIQQHKVVVGTAARKTPILSSTLTTVVLNPTWTVPPTIKKNDLVPKASSDLSYFSRLNFTIYNSQGKVVSPENWDASKGTSYRYVQKGGQGNTLGRVKFMFQNNHAVYLHDTPSQWGFARNDRNLSSGCVRVQNPFDLTTYIFELAAPSMTKEEVDKIIASQDTKSISVSETPIDVHLLYWTVQVDNQGKFTYFKDIYKYDEELYKRLVK